MKKLFLLGGVLGVFGVSFADAWNAVDDKYGYASKELEVRANVVKPLDLEVEGVDFGSVPLGKVKEQPDKLGKIEIKGSSTENVKIYLYEGTKSLGDETNLVKSPIHLKNSRDNGVVEYTPKFLTGSSGAITTATTYALDENGTLVLNIGGPVDATKAISLGEYKNDLRVRVMYE